MKFEVSRALALAESFSSLRLPGSEALGCAADRLAGELSRSGWRVRILSDRAFRPRHDPVRAGEVWPAAFLAIVAGVWFEAEIWLKGFGPHPLILGVVFSLVAAAGWISARWKRSRRTAEGDAVVGLIASRGDDERAPARLVVVTPLDTRPPLGSARFRRQLAWMEWCWLGLLWIPLLLFSALDWLETAGPALLVGLGLMAVMRRLDPWAREPSSHPSDNRTGLGMVGELARAWPTSVSPPLEINILAVGMPLAGRRPPGWLVDLFEGRSKPTLVIELISPGLGNRLFLGGGTSDARLLEDAARDLWLPVGPWTHRSVALDSRAFESMGFVGAAVIGDLESQTTDPNLIASAAQLVREAGLRWARGANSKDLESPAVANGLSVRDERTRTPADPASGNVPHG